MEELLLGLLRYLQEGVYGEHLPEHVMDTFRDVVATRHSLVRTWLFLTLVNREPGIQDMVALTQSDGGEKLRLYLPFLRHQTLAMRNTAFEVDNIEAIIGGYVECCRDAWLHNDRQTMERHQGVPNENAPPKPKGDRRKKKGGRKRATNTPPEEDILQELLDDGDGFGLGE